MSTEQDFRKFAEWDAINYTKRETQNRIHRFKAGVQDLDDLLEQIADKSGEGSPQCSEACDKWEAKRSELLAFYYWVILRPFSNKQRREFYDRMVILPDAECNAGVHVAGDRDIKQVAQTSEVSSLERVRKYLTGELESV